MKVLVAKYEVSGYFSAIAAALSSRQIQTSSLFIRDHPYYEPLNSKYLIFKLLKWSNSRREKLTRSQIVQKIMAIIIDEIIKCIVVIKSAVHFDKIIFSYGEDISGRIYEPLIYKIFKTEIIFIFLGSDIRPPSISNKFKNLKTDEDKEKFFQEEIRISKIMKKLKRHNAVILSYPAYSQYLKRQYYDIFSFGVPIVASKNLMERNNRISICHIPSNKAVKGTSEIEKIFADLKCEFKDKVEISTFENISNDEVRSVLSKHDMIITELWSDTPCPFIAIEACAEGCIPIVAGNFSEQFEKIYEGNYLPPYPYVTANNIKGAVRELIINQRLRNELSSSCKSYYINNHTVERFASKFEEFLDETKRQKFLKFNQNNVPIGNK